MLATPPPSTAAAASSVQPPSTWPPPPAPSLGFKLAHARPSRSIITSRRRCFTRLASRSFSRFIRSICPFAFRDFDRADVERCSVISPTNVRRVERADDRCDAVKKDAYTVGERQRLSFVVVAGRPAGSVVYRCGASSDVDATEAPASISRRVRPNMSRPA